MKKKLRFFSNSIDYLDLSSPEYEVAYEKYLDYFLEVETMFPHQVREILNYQSFKGRMLDRIIWHWKGYVELSFLDQSILVLQDAKLIAAPRKPIHENTVHIWCYDNGTMWYCEEVTLDENKESLLLNARLSSGLLSVQFQDASYFDGYLHRWTAGGPLLSLSKEQSPNYFRNFVLGVMV